MMVAIALWAAVFAVLMVQDWLGGPEETTTSNTALNALVASAASLLHLALEAIVP